MEGLRHGLHRSPFHGYSAEFSQYRHYRPGDDLRYVDWKRFAKTDRLYTRQFRETTSLAALFVVDASRSMDYGAKFTLARRVAAVLGTLVLDQGDGVGLLAMGQPSSYLPPRGGHRHLTAFLRALADLQPAGTVAFTEALTRAGSLLTRKGLVVAVSDCYDAGLAAALRRLGRMGHDVVVAQTLEEDEIALPRLGAVEFVDRETGGRVAVQAETVAPVYEARVRAWLDSLAGEMRREGVDYLRITTGDDLERTLRRYLLTRRGGA